MSYKTITSHTENQVVTVTLNRPETKNAMSFSMMRELIREAKRIKKDRDVRAVILTGSAKDAKDASFCSGIDLSDLNQSKNRAFTLWELVKPTQNMFQEVCLIWRSLPVPVIAVIDGHCIGAGLQMAMGTDIRIVTPNSKFAIMEAKWGLVADMGITQSALGILTSDVLKELAMTARMIDGDEAKAFGLVTHVTDEPFVKAEELIEELKFRSPDAVLASKRIVNQMYKQSGYTLYQEKLWQTKLIFGHNRKLAMKKAKDSTVKFVKRQLK